MGDIFHIRRLQVQASPGQLGVRTGKGQINALVQPSGFEVIGNMQNWITFDFHT